MPSLTPDAKTSNALYAEILAVAYRRVPLGWIIQADPAQIPAAYHDAGKIATATVKARRLKLENLNPEVEGFLAQINKLGNHRGNLDTLRSDAFALTTRLADAVSRYAAADAPEASEPPVRPYSRRLSR